MKYFLIIILFSASVYNIHAQCNQSIPSSATVKSSDGDIKNSGTYWVCEGVTVDVLAFASTIYAEKNSNVKIHNGKHKVYIKSGGYVIINSDTCVVVHASDATVGDNGWANKITACPGAMTFSYSSAPTSGCSVSTGIENEIEDNLLNIYPNPVTNVINIEYIGSDRLLSYQMLRMDGQKVADGQFNSNKKYIQVSSLESGIYILKITSSSGVLTKKILVR